MALIDKYSKDELLKIVNESISYKEVLKKLGYKSQNGNNSVTLKKRIAQYHINTDHFMYVTPTTRTYENVFCKDSTCSQQTLRRWYFLYFEHEKCKICGIDNIWNNKELTMTLDHINGDNHDNRIENLRIICTNCGSQLETFAGRNSQIHKTA